MPELSEVATMRMSPEELSERLLDLSISQKFLERATGMPAGTISNWKTGTIKGIKSVYWPRIIQTLHNVEALLNHEELIPASQKELPQEDLVDTLSAAQENCSHIKNRIIRKSTVSMLEAAKAELKSRGST